MPLAPPLVFRMQMTVEFDAPLVIASGPLGDRRILRVARGAFEGPSMRGEVLPGGGDWVLGRQDGSTELDIRFTLRAQGGELIFLRSMGLFVASPAIASRIRGGHDVPADSYYFRTSIVFETGATALSEMNRALHLGVGQRTPTGMVTDIFAVS